MSTNLQKYLDMKKRHTKELEEFPIAYAYNNEQFKAALEKLGAKKEECCTIHCCGDIVRKSDVPRYKKMMQRIHDETIELLKSDPKVAEEAFLYEMNNHEYAINWSGDEDVLDAFGLTEDTLEEYGLERAYDRAMIRTMREAQKNGLI